MIDVPLANAIWPLLTAIADQAANSVLDTAEAAGQHRERRYNDGSWLGHARWSRNIADDETG